MSLAAQVIDQHVSGIVERQTDVFTDELRLGSDEHRRRSVAFLFLVARTAFDLTDDQTLDGIVDGGADFGIDALYFQQPEDGELHVTLVQGKYKQSLDGGSESPENGIEKMIGAIGALFDPAQPVQLNKRLNDRVEDIRSFVKDGAIPRVTAIAANNGIRWSEQAQQRILNARQDFGEQVEWRHIGSTDLVTLLQARQPINAELKLTGRATVETFNYRRTLTGRMSVAELARLTDEYDNRLFEKNIRRYPGLSGNRVDEAVASTLRVRDQRPTFYFYNNGITITCSQFRHNALQSDDWSVQVSDLQIVNGGQTARTVQQVARDVGREIGEAEVLVRLYELPQDDAGLVEAITFATNSQNPVDLRDLRAKRWAPAGPEPVGFRVGLWLSRQARGTAGVGQRIHERRRRGSRSRDLAPPAAPGTVQESRALRRAVQHDLHRRSQRSAGGHRRPVAPARREPPQAPSGRRTRFPVLRVPLHGHVDGPLSA